MEAVNIKQIGDVIVIVWVAYGIAIEEWQHNVQVCVAAIYCLM